MKTRFYNILVPKFLRNFDDYLLRNYPVVWRTKAIWVLFYGLVGAIILFAAGFFYPVDAQHLTVAPHKAIIMGCDNYHLLSVGFVNLGVIYWAFRQYQLKFTFTKVKDTLLTLVLYGCCFWFLFGITTPAFRIGTIVKTANYWIKDKDLQDLKNSGIYPYGIVLLQSDSISYIVTPSDTFFKKRHTLLKSIYEVEDTLFQHIYTKDTKFWTDWFDKYDYLGNSKSYWADFLQLSYLSHLSYLSDMSYLSQMSNLSDGIVISFDISDNSWLLNLSYESYRRDWSKQWQWQLSDISYDSKGTYIFYRTENLSKFDMHKLDYTFQMPILQLDKQFNNYNFKNNLDSIEYLYKKDSIKTIYRPALPYSVENAVRSVKNAQMYLQENIYIKHLYLILSYTLVLSLLFYFIPFISVRYLFVLSALCSISAILIIFVTPKYPSETIGIIVSNTAYIIIPLLSCIWVVVSTFKKKQLIGFTFVIQGLFIGLLLVLVSALFVIYRIKFNFNQIENYQPPYNLAFYGVQVLGVIGSMLTTYVRTLPKQ